MKPALIDAREIQREQQFTKVWNRDLNQVFANIAPFYDIANYVASFGLWGWFRSRFMRTIEINPNERVLDVCAGTNAIGIALLKREASLDMHAIDRSAEMQAVGQRNATAQGFRIHGVIGDAHTLPFPDNHFDVVTLQFASRHLRVKEVFSEIQRVLKPGGRFYHCDMLRPGNRIVEALYYGYLRFVLCFTAFVFRAGDAALNCKRYFVKALQSFYSVQELSGLLREQGYQEITATAIFSGMLGFHGAIKPAVTVQASRNG